MSGWLDRPGYVALLAFVAGAAVAGLVLFFVLTGDGDDDGEQQVTATTTAEGTPAITPTVAEGTSVTGTATVTPGPLATATPVRFQDPDEALAAFIRDEFDSEHIGQCPQELAPGGPPEGICSAELYRSEELVTFRLGVPFSEFFGEAVLTLDEEGFWSVEVVQAPPLGESDISVGSEAVVFGAGSCLNFREEPGASAEVVFCLIDGTTGAVVEGPVEADDSTWWRLEGLGWASAEFLAPVTE